MLRSHNIFEIVFLIGFVAGTVVRKVCEFKSRGLNAKNKHSNVTDFVLVGMAGAGLVMPFLYLFTPWLNFANYNLPAASGWVGTVLFAGAIFMLWRSHVDLGRNFSVTLRIAEQHSLVTSGVYHYIRHPMYTAHLLWAISQGLLLSNWLAGWAFLVLSFPLYVVRIPKEERMMIEHFGEEYDAYKSRTGRLIPHIWK